MEEKVENTRLSLYVSDAKKGDEIVIKITYFPAWKAYADGEEIEIKKWEYNLMSLTLPKDGEYLVELKYSYLKGEIEGLIITFLRYLYVSP